MKKVALTVSGKRYEVTLEDTFADFVTKDLQDAGVDLHQDNKPQNLLKAYLRVAKQLYDYNKEIEYIVELMEREE